MLKAEEDQLGRVESVTNGVGIRAKGKEGGGKGRAEK